MLDIDDPDGEIQQWLNEKYGGKPDERWKREIGEYHSSEMGKCARKTFLKFVDEAQGRPSGDFRYFEFGIWFEDKYEEKLVEEYGSDYILQDVGIEIHLPGDIRIVGESDWCVLNRPYNGDPIEYELLEDETRLEHSDEGTREIGEDDEPIVKEVIETKTIGSLWYVKGQPKHPHSYQIMSYLKAIGVDGRVTYMQRDILSENELMAYLYRCDHEEMEVPDRLHERVNDAFHNDLREQHCDVNFSEYTWYRIVEKAHLLHNKLIAAANDPDVPHPREIDLDGIDPYSKKTQELMPATDPYDRSFECNFCNFTAECTRIGGSRWDS